MHCSHSKLKYMDTSPRPFYLEPNLGRRCFSTSFLEDDNFSSAKALAIRGVFVCWVVSKVENAFTLDKEYSDGALVINKPPPSPLVFTKRFIQLRNTMLFIRMILAISLATFTDCPCRSGGPATSRGSYRYVLLLDLNALFTQAPDDYNAQVTLAIFSMVFLVRAAESTDSHAGPPLLLPRHPPLLLPPPRRRPPLLLPPLRRSPLSRSQRLQPRV